MAVEIFTVPNSDGATQRSYGNDVTLTKPSAVYFGKSAPGIAYYEKAGTDLQVTLLDGQEVTLRNFFVIDAQGEFNRLELGPNGPVEVTGMLAPEPEIPNSGQIEPVLDAQGLQQPASAIPASETVAAQDGSPSADNSSPDGDRSDTSNMFGVSMDQLIFGLMTAPIALSALGGFNHKKTSGDGDGFNALLVGAVSPIGV